MNLIIWLIAGGVVGWLASLLMRTDGEQGVLLNVLVGIVGAAIGGWVISPLVGIPSINDGSLALGALVVSLLGSVVLLAIVDLIRRSTTR